MWQILRDINDLIKEEPHREEIKIADVDRIKRKRYKQEVYRRMIRNYLRQNNKWIQKLTKEDIAIMTQWMNDIDRTMFLDQVKSTLETNYGKPIKWIIENHKSVLFNK